LYGKGKVFQSDYSVHGQYQAFETILDCPRCLEQIQSSDAVTHISQPANPLSKGRDINLTSVATMIHIAFAYQLLRQSTVKGPWLFSDSLHGIDESISQPLIRCDEQATP
jgi:hypothetical protein